MRKKITTLFWIVCITLLSSCATLESKDPQDPYEVYNRKAFLFNVLVDKALFRPAAIAYSKVVPEKAQAHVTYFFHNIDAIPSVANDILQLDVYDTFADSSRFLVNSTVGVLGLFDVATHIHLPYHHNDFGLTLARWGMQRSPYFVIPFLGPATIRDAFGDAGNIYMSVWPYVPPAYLGWGAFAVQKVNFRAALLPTDKLIEQAFDPYEFVRDAYLQNRQISINQVTRKTASDAHGSDTFVAANGQNNLPSATSNDQDTFVAPSDDEKSSGAAPNNDNQDTFVAP